MNLTALDPQFLRADDAAHFRHVETLAEAHGISFLCPRCFRENGGPIGTHRVICWSRSRGAPEQVLPGPGRWAMAGAGYSDLTLTGDNGASNSVSLHGGCQWHGFVTAGEVSDA